MAVKRIKGESNIEMLAKKASTAFSAGMFVTYDAATGFIKPLVATDPDVMGICLQKITSTDADYASNTRIQVDQLGEGVVLEIDITAGTLAATDEGQFFKMDTGAVSIDAGTRSSTHGAGFTAQGLVLLCKRFLSASKGEFVVISRSNTRPSST